MVNSIYQPIWKENYFEVHYKSCHRNYYNFKEECLLSAQKIFQDSNGLPRFILMSGGIDCEIVARSFIEAGYSFTPVYFKFNKFIREDFYHLKTFCQNYKLNLKIIDFDENQFFEKEFVHLLDKYDFKEPFSVFDYQRMKMIDGYSIFGAGDIVLEFKQNNIYSYEMGSLYLAEEIFKSEGGLTCYQFFQNTSELMLSFLNEPIIKKWIEICEYMNFPDSRQFKAFMYKYYWPDLQLRRKYTGYERIADRYLHYQKNLKDKFKKFTDRYEVPLEILKKELSR